VTAPDVLVVPAGDMTFLRPTAGRTLPLALGAAPVLASARGGWMSCPAWALPEAQRKALAARLRSLAWLVENCVPDEAEARACG
jgi:hypothetical protein